MGHDAHDSPDAHAAHDAHGAHPPAPPEPEGPPPPHVLRIASVTRVLGLLLWALGGVALLVAIARCSWPGIGGFGFASVYGFSIWLAARETLAKAQA